MLYIRKIDDYLKTLTDEEVKDFAAIHFGEYFKSIREEQNLRKIAKSLYILPTALDEVKKYVQPNPSDNCIHSYNVEILNIFDPEMQLINTKPMIKNKLKELLSKLKKFKVQAILVLDYKTYCIMNTEQTSKNIFTHKKRNDRKIFHSSTKLIASDSDINKAFKFMHQSILTKIKKCAWEEWIALDVIIKHSIKIFECYYKEKKLHQNRNNK